VPFSITKVSLAAGAPQSFDASNTPDSHNTCDQIENQIFIYRFIYKSLYLYKSFQIPIQIPILNIAKEIMTLSLTNSFIGHNIVEIFTSFKSKGDSESHRGQAYFSSLPGVDIHSE
jgi:hypothetical protein